MDMRSRRHDPTVRVPYTEKRQRCRQIAVLHWPMAGRKRLRACVHLRAYVRPYGRPMICANKCEYLQTRALVAIAAAVTAVAATKKMPPSSTYYLHFRQKFACRPPKNQPAVKYPAGNMFLLVTVSQVRPVKRRILYGRNSCHCP